MTSTRFANLLIDAADKLAEARTPDESWNVINDIAARIGANAVNAGAFLRGAPQIAWMRTSMQTGWLAEYAEAAFHETDPLLRAAIDGRPPPLYDVARREALGSGDRTHSPLHDGMLRHDYRYMLTHSWFEGDAGKCLVLSSGHDPFHLFGPGTGRAFSAISALLSLNLHPPGARNIEGRAFGARWQALGPEERDIFSYLALGHSEAAIAERLGVTGDELSRRIGNGCAKMGAATRDQALALAMTRGLLAI